MAGKKQKTARIPKRIAGVKVPKKLRKSAAAAFQWAENPVVNQAVSAALVAGAGALAARKSARDTAKAAGLGAGVGAVKGAEGAGRIGVALSEIAAGLFAAAAEGSNAATSGRAKRPTRARKKSASGS